MMNDLYNNMQGLYLPRQLACRLIELQVGMHEGTTLNREAILELLDCYTRSVEFYNQKNDEKRHKYYQRKMQDFLQRPAITQVLQQGKKSDLTLRKEKNEEQVRRMSNQSTIMAKKMLQNSTEQSRKQQLMLKATLAQQEQTLEERIQRKRANSSRNNRPKLTSASFGCSPNNDKKMLNTFIDLPSPPAHRQN